MKLLRNYEQKVINPRHKAINEKFKKRAKSVEVPTQYFMEDLPEYDIVDFSKMGIEDLKNVKPANLSLEEKAALERLKELGY